MDDKRKKRVRYKLKKVTSRKRLSVFRSNKHLYAQVIDDSVGKTLASASSKEKGIDTSVKDRNNPIEHNCVKCNKKVEAHRIFSSPLILSDDIGRGFKRMKDKDLYKELDMD